MPARPAVPTASPTMKPRWPRVPYPMNNGTAQSTSKPNPPNVPNAVNQTPLIPSPVYESVTVAPADSLPSSPPHSSIPQYVGTAGSAAILLQGYCTEPAYTIIDGPTAIWMPVVGCISSKSDCCPTPTTQNLNNAPNAPTGGGSPDANPTGIADARNGVAQFPISFMPSQGTLTGCPADYHTVGGTACCPSSYWLWSTTLGGQVPCYSSLSSTLDPPPIPDTLVNGVAMITGSTNPTATTKSNVPALTMSQKPTSAIVNIQFSMQYPVVPPPKPALEKKAKIGIGVGASSAGLILVVLLWFLIRKFFAHRKTKGDLRQMQQTTLSQRWGSGVDMSRVAHEPAGVARTHRGKTYTGVSSAAVNY